MEQYISLEPLLDKIERRKKEWSYGSSTEAKYKVEAYKEVIDLFDNIEVKETNLEKHLKEDIEDVFFDLNGVAIKGATHYLTVEDIKDIAKHFFELGMRASNPLTWEDINSILYIERLVLREFGGQEHSNEELCREVLKRFKETKKVD